MAIFDLEKRFNQDRLEEFADKLKQLQLEIGFKVSARGWCYIMEQNRFINKDQFNKVEELINKCRRQGILPVDFVAEEAARQFSGVVEKSDKTIKQTLQWMLRDVLDGHKYNSPDFWEGEEYYVQMVVEKIDLVTLFSPVCQDYKIPIANAKGWSSILQRAEYARRFKNAEDRGLKCVLLYCGDHDPDGLRISDTLRENLRQVRDIVWSKGGYGYDPRDLEIKRFGLNYEFIEQHGYTWIDNLVTGSGMNLASPSHRNFRMPYVQDYLEEIGERKCEANAIVTTPDIARELCKETIEEILGEDAIERFEAKEQEIEDAYLELLEQYDLQDRIRDILAETREDE